MALMCLFWPAAVEGQSWSIEPRLGVIMAGALFEDAAVEGFEPVRVGPAPALSLGAVGRTVLRPDWALELELTWSPGTVRAQAPEGDRDISDLRVIAGTVRMRRALGPLFGAAGAGVVAYSAPDARVYAEGGSVFPAGTLALAMPVSFGAIRSHVEANMLLHRHQTTVLERAGADAAMTWRAGIGIGIELGGGR